MGYIDELYNTAGFNVYGALYFNGNSDNMIDIKIDEFYEGYFSIFTWGTDATIYFN